MANARREYFYFIAETGRLFLEDVRIKNVHSGLKDVKFLDFFWRRLKPNPEENKTRYPFLSTCVGEYNFVAVANRPVVFHTLETTENRHALIYAGSLQVPLQPELLRVHPETGYFYHQIEGILGPYGLLSSHMCCHFAQQIDERGLHWDGHVYPIKELEKHAL
eukprot:GEMP01055556.1.p1 GENE.GEMP01055556.1~~GEMP01055556.1.p1  ORF type:complete len:163 (+),score=27.50 GEMP01055556.1:328-816(+)